MVWARSAIATGWRKVLRKRFSLADLVAHCEARQRDAEKERDEANRYAAWMWSSEGQANKDKWVGTIESVDEDRDFWDEEAQFWAALLRQLRPINRRHRLLLEGSNH